MMRIERTLSPTRAKLSGALAAAALSAAPSLPGIALGAPTTSEPELADGAIEAEVESELLLDPAVQLADLKVRVNDGIVTLTGTADSLGEKDRAATVAGTVRGVRSVVNRLKVQPEEDLPPEQLAARVESALLRNPATESFEIDADARVGGIVILEGTVDSWREKNIARRVSANVAGVTGLDNRIDIDIVSGRPDDELKAEIEQAMKWDALIDHRDISVEVEEGVVTLAGVVGSQAEKSEAVYDAYVRGVSRVDESGLKVAGWAEEHDARRPGLVDWSDAEVKAAIQDAMQRDPRVDDDDVSLRVRDGVVGLSGTVHSLSAKRTASAIARRTTGVLAVKNDLTVKPSEPRPDDRIENDVEQALAASPAVQATGIEAKVKDGIVTLTGSVDSNHERMRVSHLTEDIVGVRLVENQLQVESNEPVTYDPYIDDVYVYDYAWYNYEPSTTTQSDVEIAREIRDELWWSPFVDSDDVAIIVEDGIATLTGQVDSWAERESATENAYEAGAIWVDNDLGVR
jgi:osmotically-inducible protein OsmY